MQKVEITQLELNVGSGKFHEYMKFVVHRLAAKLTDPRHALFAAANIITSDGLTLIIGSESDDAGVNVANWLHNFYGEREHISYCFPALAFQLSGTAYLLRFLLLRPSQILVTQAVIDLTDQAADQISAKSLALLEKTYNEFYNALYLISRLDTTTVKRLEASAHHIYDGAAHYAMARWESLYFIECAMKEVLLTIGVTPPTGGDGHAVGGRLHDVWLAAGKPPLPFDLLNDIKCSAAIRYEKTPQPFIATMRAHHAAIKLGALIAQEMPAPPIMEDELPIESKSMDRDPVLALARAMQSIDPSVIDGPYVTLLQ